LKAVVWNLKENIINIVGSRRSWSMRFMVWTKVL